MRVLIDADGCPVVRETVRQCAAFYVPCLLFCDTAHVFSIPGVEVFVADCGHDSTDYLLLSHLRPGDVVITQDYGLAAAIGILVFVICATLSLIVYNNSKSMKDEEAFS